MILGVWKRYFIHRQDVDRWQPDTMRKCHRLIKVFQSCGNRHCPSCQQHKTRQWREKQLRGDSRIVRVAGRLVVLRCKKQKSLAGGLSNSRSWSLSAATSSMSCRPAS
ncbi:MAG: transposase zinc-binding domain-containing protein [Deltaproteobacteria bacterium]|nr:transposase zinc-binding domain-containing protein [Deltaproteobacteria bacterium]